MTALTAPAFRTLSDLAAACEPAYHGTKESRNRALTPVRLAWLDFALEVGMDKAKAEALFLRAKATARRNVWGD
jgi:hypothetical protein